MTEMLFRRALLRCLRVHHEQLVARSDLFFFNLDFWLID